MSGAPTSDNWVRLIETWRVQWSLLRLAVQLDQRWVLSLRPQTEEAVEEVFAIARQLGGVTRDIGNLGEMRTHVLDQILETGAKLIDNLSALDVSLLVQQRLRCAEDVLFIARALQRSVGMHSGELTFNPAAQRALWYSIAASRDRSEMPHRGSKLTRETCCHVLSRLDELLSENHQPAQIHGAGFSAALRRQANHS
jgi:hypothetical protein